MSKPRGVAGVTSVKFCTIAVFTGFITVLSSSAFTFHTSDTSLLLWTTKSSATSVRVNGLIGALTLAKELRLRSDT